MTKRTLEKRSVRVDPLQEAKVMKLLGINDSSKAIRACMNFTLNVAHNMFGGNLSNMFKRRKDNEEIGLFDQDI